MARLAALRGADVDDIEGVAAVEQIIDGPFQSKFASPWEVQGHPNFPIFRHVPFFLTQRKPRKKITRMFRVKDKQMGLIQWRRSCEMIVYYALNISWAFSGSWLFPVGPVPYLLYNGSCLRRKTGFRIGSSLVTRAPSSMDFFFFFFPAEIYKIWEKNDFIHASLLPAFPHFFCNIEFFFLLEKKKEFFFLKLGS